MFSAAAAGTDNDACVGTEYASSLATVGATLSSSVSSSGTFEAVELGGVIVMVKNPVKSSLDAVGVADGLEDTADDDADGLADTADDDADGLEDAADDDAGLGHRAATSPPSSRRRSRPSGDTNDCLHERITACCAAVRAEVHADVHTAVLAWKLDESGQAGMSAL